MSDGSSHQERELGVFSSIDAGFGVSLETAHQLGVPTMHLHAPHKDSRTRESADRFREEVDRLGMRVTVVFAGFDGESYADIPTVKETIGLVPRHTREQRVRELCEIIEFTQMLGVDATGLHIGFVPHNPLTADHQEVVSTMRTVCDFAAERSINLHLETGQEPAEVLERFLLGVDRPNLFVNFDPANMILYGCGEPIPALRRIGRFVRSVHCKDARWSDQPGITWGSETALGEGDVPFKEYLETLDEIGYRGPLTIERELSQDPVRQMAEISGAIRTLGELTSDAEQGGSVERR